MRIASIYVIVLDNSQVNLNFNDNAALGDTRSVNALLSESSSASLKNFNSTLTTFHL